MLAITGLTMQNCSEHQSNKVMKQNDVDKCNETLSSFADKKFDDWQGLAKECTLEKIASFFQLFKEATGSGTLGRKYIRTFFKMYIANNYEKHIKVWFRDNKIIKIEASFPEIPNGHELLVKKYGEPTARLDFYLDIMLVKEGEWVYADKGISLFFSSKKEKLIKLHVYSPTSIENYKDSIYYFTPMREFKE